jgi:putative addiction module CopG family antidote
MLGQQGRKKRFVFWTFLRACVAWAFDKEPKNIQTETMRISLAAHQEKFIAKKLKSGGYRSRSEVVREALRVYELVEEKDHDHDLEEDLNKALRGPAKKYTTNHFSNLVKARKGNKR